MKRKKKKVKEKNKEKKEKKIMLWLKSRTQQWLKVQNFKESIMKKFPE